jgi:putative ABC transport system ATP-binding protein
MLQMINISKSFQQGDQLIQVLHEFKLDLKTGETLALLGPSGSGKSTLLSLVAGLDRPDAGSIMIDHQHLNQMNEEQLTAFRAANIGIIFQQFHLFSHLTALENVMLPLEILNQPQAAEKAKDTLKKVGLIHRLEHFPHQMSGGENQRIAIARALVIKPRILLADEPSGSLDQKTGEQVMDILFDLVKKEKITLVLVTHNELLAKRCQKHIHLSTSIGSPTERQINTEAD